MNGLGLAAGLGTALVWTATALCFEASGKRLGSFTVNVLRLVVAGLLFFGLSLSRTHTLLPPQLTFVMWRDLGLSGLVGFVVGDLMLFQAFVLIGARLSMLVYASVPAMTAIGGYLFLREVIGPQQVFGMFVTGTGIVLAVFANRRHASQASVVNRQRGVLLALGGSAGQAAGLLLGKQGSIGLDAFAATHIRVLVGLVGFLVVGAGMGALAGIGRTVFVAVGPTQRLTPAERTRASAVRRALFVLVIGSVLGPFLGVSLGLLSAQLLPTGVASTLMSIEPVLLVPLSAAIFHERVTRFEILGTLIALGGVAILAW
jgi:drug/metabolite transporter (DMT)-like permease